MWNPVEAKLKSTRDLPNMKKMVPHWITYWIGYISYKQYGGRARGRLDVVQRNADDAFVVAVVLPHGLVAAQVP